MPDEIEEAARVEGYNGLVYSIGSFAERVNFLAQQYRALNTVWALYKRGRFKEGDRIAVIGAGIAGITAAAAFMAFKAIVHVYESRKVLHRQLQTGHRRVHPNVNLWPAATLTHTTELPFFDWYSGPCKEIAQELAKGFNSLFEDGSPHLLFEKSTAKSIREIGTQLLAVTCDPPVRLPRPTNIELSYRLALITVGFGEERQLTPFKTESYWRADNLEARRDSDDLDEFIVSGCGDGGLIDALRIVHPDFDAGRMAFDVARMLSGTPVAQLVKKAEEALRSGSKDGLRDAYVTVAGKIRGERRYGDVHELLSRSLSKFSGTVYLGDSSVDSPFVSKAAPIHKLLIAHAAECSSSIKFRPGIVTQSDDEVIASGKAFSKALEDHVVIRHGAEPDFKDLLDNVQFDALEAKQKGRVDFHDRRHWRPKQYRVPSQFPKHDPTDKEFIKSRSDLARDAIRGICKTANVWIEPGQFRVTFPEGALPEQPKRLFGIKTKYAAEPKHDEDSSIPPASTV